MVGNTTHGGGKDGLSRRARGNGPVGRADAARLWSIPACAGKWWVTPLTAGAKTVYPGVRGGMRLISADTARIYGLSRRARGNGHRKEVPMPRIRSIPACAGECVKQGTWNVWSGPGRRRGIPRAGRVRFSAVTDGVRRRGRRTNVAFLPCAGTAQGSCSRSNDPFIRRRPPSLLLASAGHDVSDNLC